VRHFVLHCPAHDEARAAFVRRARTIAGAGHLPLADLAHLVVPPHGWPKPQRIKYARGGRGPEFVPTWRLARPTELYLTY